MLFKNINTEDVIKHNDEYFGKYNEEMKIIEKWNEKTHRKYVS